MVRGLGHSLEQGNPIRNLRLDFSKDRGIKSPFVNWIPAFARMTVGKSRGLR